MPTRSSSLVGTITAVDAGRLVVPCAQNFRVRDPETHALRAFDLSAGGERVIAAEGIPTAAAVDGETVAMIEEPIVYHDEGEKRGSYALHLG